MASQPEYNFRSLAITSIGCDEARKIMDFFLHMTERKINVNLSLQKNMLLLADLIRREPMPMVGYINGQGMLKRIMLKGAGTKKDPYHFEWSGEYYRDT